MVKFIRFLYRTYRPFNANTVITDDTLREIAYTKTRWLSRIANTAFYQKLEDKHYMRIASLLAEKGYNEGGCPIGGVIKENHTGKILGKGHNTLVQENHPYNHGETAALRDAGRQDFSQATLYTTLSPCDICATLIYMRQFNRAVVGDITNARGNEEALRARGVQVDILEDPKAVQLYARYRAEKPEQDTEDWLGLAGVTHPGKHYPTGIGLPPLQKK